MKSAFFLLFLLHAMQLFSQPFQGNVIDAVTGEGIPFAHVIPGSGKGAITDLYGHFELESVPAGTLTISCLGYISTTINLEQEGQHKNSQFVISLEQNIIELDEVIVTPEDPEMLLQEAFRKIPENYDSSVSLYSGYYRLSANLQDKNIRYKEAFIDLVKYPYQLYSPETYIPKDSMVIRESRIRHNEIDDWKMNVMLPWERSIYFLNFRDAVKDYITMDDPDKHFFQYYDYEIENMVLVNGRRTYKIELHPKRGPKKAYWNGYIYLDEESLAFVKFDLVSREKAIKDLRSDLGYIILSKLYNIKYDSGEWKESISYRKIGEKWYFDEVNSSKFFLISSNKRSMDEVPAKFNLHFKTGSIESGVRVDTMRFLEANLPSHKEDSILVARYDPGFWQRFDREAGNPEDTASFNYDSSRMGGTGEYVFSRLDTLQGALTPLREVFDVTFYQLDVEVLPEEEILRGSSTVHFTMSGDAGELQLDLYDQLAIDSILYNGQTLDFRREYNAVFIEFPEILKSNSRQQVTVFYQGRPVDIRPEIPMYAAFIWAEDQEGDPWFQAICQGYGASGWWPVKDHLSDEPDSAMIRVTVPRGLDVISNGRLRDKMQYDGKTTFEWFVSYPINNYNITLNAGKYSEIDDYYLSGNDTLDLQYFVLPYHEEIAREKLVVVKPMLRIYEKYFGNYPFVRDGFKLVESPHAMEHQSAVSIGEDFFRENAADPNEPDTARIKDGWLDFQIILHESAHEWWGNNVSCSDNAELWLHEAFATYAETLFVEDFYGPEYAVMYLNGLKKGVKNKYPVIGEYGVNHIHYDIWDMYSKGALVLNTFRNVLDNDSLWFGILKGIQQEFRYQTISTPQVLDYIYQQADRNYQSFFDQYLNYTSLPVLEWKINEMNDIRTMSYRWVADVQDFSMPVEYSIPGNMPVRLHPTTAWQDISLPSDIKVLPVFNTDKFFINVVTSP